MTSRPGLLVAVGLFIVVASLAAVIAIRSRRADVGPTDRSAPSVRVEAAAPDPNARALEVFAWIGGPGYPLRREAEAAWSALADCQHVPVAEFVACVDEFVVEVERLAAVIRAAEIPAEVAETYDAVALDNEELACVMRTDAAWMRANERLAARARGATDWMEWQEGLGDGVSEAAIEAHVPCYRPGTDRPNAGQTGIWLNAHFTYHPPRGAMTMCWNLDRVREVVETGVTPDPTPCRD